RSSAPSLHDALPISDALSLDAHRRSLAGARQEASRAWQYGFAIRLICALTVCAYFVTGIAKVASPLGWLWATGQSIRSQVAADRSEEHTSELQSRGH